MSGGFSGYLQRIIFVHIRRTPGECITLRGSKVCRGGGLDITSEPKGRKEYLPCFAVAAVYSGEQNGLHQMYYLSSEIITNAAAS